MAYRSSSTIFPPPLKPGGTIGIVSPGRWLKPELIAKGKALLEKRGYQTVVHAQNYLQDGQLAGSDAARAEAIMDMFADRTIDAVMCARGGTGSIRLLERLDYKLIRRNPKPFIGFSDITVLLQAITRRCSFVTYHGPMTIIFAEKHDPRSVDDFFNVIGAKKSVRLRYPEAKAIRSGQAEGVLVGGNITLLQTLIGTPYDWASKDTILFIEDVDEILYRLDRTLYHLKLAGKFDGIRAVLVGEMCRMADGETGFARKGERPYGKTLKEILLDVLPPDIPLCFDVPCGHGGYVTTLPYGAEVKVSVSGRGVELVFPSSPAGEVAKT